MMDVELLAQVWLGGEEGSLERAVIEVERSDLDEVRLGVLWGNIAERNEDEVQHVYLERDRALRLGHALIEQALAPWST